VAGAPSSRDPFERLAAELAHMTRVLESLRQLVIIGGIILIVLMIIGVVLEISMYSTVQSIKSAGV
jgi:hypothetical protein